MALSDLRIMPNPFVSSTQFNFTVKTGHVLIQVVDTQGRLISTVVDAQYFQGKYTVTFNSGKLPAGMYYVRLQNGPRQVVKTVMKVRG